MRLFVLVAKFSPGYLVLTISYKDSVISNSVPSNWSAFLQGLQKILESRSATASLLIKRTKFMEKKVKLVIVLAQESKHIVLGSCWGNRGAYFLRREIMWGLAQWKRTCCSSCTSSVSHRSQVGELL